QGLRICDDQWRGVEGGKSWGGRGGAHSPRGRPLGFFWGGGGGTGRGGGGGAHGSGPDGAGPNRWDKGAGPSPPPGPPGAFSAANLTDGHRGEPPLAKPPGAVDSF